MMEIYPVIGEKYKIVLPRKHCLDHLKSTEAVYLGHNPVSTHPFLVSKVPEGHLFARLTAEGKAALYEARIAKPSLREMWTSDDEEGPAWPIGIAVMEYLQEGVSGANLNPLEVAV